MIVEVLSRLGALLYALVVGGLLVGLAGWCWIQGDWAAKGDSVVKRALGVTVVWVGFLCVFVALYLVYAALAG